MKCLIYVTKSKPYLTRIWKDQFELATLKEVVEQDTLNGKIVAEFDGEVEEITKDISSVVEEWYSKELLKKSCLTAFELDDYLKGKKGYAIHIKNLHIFDKPKELSDFYRYDNSYDNMFGWAFEDRKKFIPLKKAPQNMMKVYDKDGNEYILISIRPEWDCKILNGEKTIEVRRKVLKEML